MKNDLLLIWLVGIGFTIAFWFLLGELFGVW